MSWMHGTAEHMSSRARLSPIGFQIGFQSFRLIREGGCYCVDNTGLILIGLCA